LEQKQRVASPAKTTLAKLREAGYITDGKVTLLHPDGEDTTDLPLRLLVGIRLSLIDADTSKMDKALRLLTDLKTAGLLDEVLKHLS